MMAAVIGIAAFGAIITIIALIEDYRRERRRIVLTQTIKTNYGREIDVAEQVIR